MRLVLETEGHRWPISCDVEAAPKTLRAVACHLPLAVRLQTPKIAGGHLYWQAPFVADLERVVDVMGAPPGAFMYWPERQFLEIVFAPLQQENATVTLLGALENGDDVAPMAAFGERLRVRVGHEIIEGRLDWAPGEAPQRPLPPPVNAALAEVRGARERLWAERPSEVTALLADRGILHPAGPLHFAEADARTLQELLWWWRRDGDLDAQAPAIAIALDKAASRLAGFCHLEASAAPLAACADLLRTRRAPAAEVVDEAILCLGGLSAWLDLAMPWDDVNEALRQAHGG